MQWKVYLFILFLGGNFRWINQDIKKTTILYYYAEFIASIQPPKRPIGCNIITKDIDYITLH